MYELTARAINQVIKDPLAKLLLIVICDHANDKGECYPSTITLSRRTGMHRSSVARKLNDLETAGYIKRKRTAYGSNTYHVALSDTPVAHSDTHVAEGDSNQSLINHKPRRTSISDDWFPSDEVLFDINNIRTTNGLSEVNHDHEVIKFRDYYQSKGTQFADIGKAYRVWCRNIKQFGQRTSSSAFNSSKQSSGSNSQGDRFRTYLSSVSQRASRS